MKSVKVNLNSDVVTFVLLLVILGLVIRCCVKQYERFDHCHCKHNKPKSN